MQTCAFGGQGASFTARQLGERPGRERHGCRAGCRVHLVAARQARLGGALVMPRTPTSARMRAGVARLISRPPGPARKCAVRIKLVRVLLVQRGRVLFEVAEEPCKACLGHAHDAVGGAVVDVQGVAVVAQDPTAGEHDVGHVS